MTKFRIFQRRKVLVIMLLMLAHIATAYSQQSKITVNFTKTPLRSVLVEIEKQSNLSFSFNNNLIDQYKDVSISLNKASLPATLAKLSEVTGLEYNRLTDDVITITKKEQPKSTGTKSDNKRFNIKGLVTDENNEPLIGATVLAKGTTNGASTDITGEFNLRNIKVGDILVVSYVGYHSKNVHVKSASPLRLQLEPTANNLEDVVVIGYGTQRKRDVTTSISSVKASDIKDFPVSSVEQALVGKMAGVQITQTEGTPGGGMSIKVRGTGSITAGNDPLYVIDGVPMSDLATEGTDMTVNPLSGIDMNDIESIEVLKDASAAAIYGSRGANGVVIVTTKQGKEGRPVVRYDGYVGWSQSTKKLDLLNAYEYADLCWEAHNNSYLDLLESKGITGGSIYDSNEERLAILGVKAGTTNVNYLIPEEIMPYVNGEQGLPSYNWQDAVLRTAFKQKHSVSVSGGTKAINYYISGNYGKEEGIVRGSDQETFGGRAKVKAQYGKFRFGTNVGISHILYNLVPTEDRYTKETIIATSTMAAPVMPIYNEDGSYNFDHYRWSYKQPQLINPVALANLREDKMKRNKVTSNTYIEYDIIKGLRLKTEFSTDFNSFRRNIFRPSTLPTTVNKTPPSIPSGTTRTKDSFGWTWESTLAFDRKFNKVHNLNAVIGYSMQKESLDASQISATDFANDLVHTLNYANVASSWSSSRQAWSLMSFIARAQYNYDHKYLVSAAIRADGSSRFGPNNRWGYFPSFSAGWYLSEEDFLKEQTWLNTLKIRASYGISGNFSIGNYEYYSNLKQDNYVTGAGIGNKVIGLYPSSEGNPDLGWEKTAMADIGIDFGIFNMLRLELDFYNSNTSDMLLNVRVPELSGYTYVRRNIGKVNNKGFEATLTSSNRWGDFSMTNSFNFALNRNKVVDLGGDQTEMVDVYQSVLYFNTKVGEPIGNYYTLVADGVFMNQAEIDIANDPNDKRIAKVEGAKPGDMKFVDQNGDGIITSDDKAITGNYMPDFTYGFSTSMQWKWFDLNVSFQGVYGNEIANIQRRYIDNMEGGGNSLGHARNRWRSEENPGDGRTVRANRSATGMNGQISTWHIEDGSYLRISNITFGISCPEKWRKRIGANSLRLYFTAYNPFTFTKYSGYNPEVSNSTNPLMPGIDYGTYPIAKSFVVGLNLSF